MIGENEKLIECYLHDTMRNLDWCEENCARYYKCDAVTAALAEESEDSVNMADNFQNGIDTLNRHRTP